MAIFPLAPDQIIAQMWSSGVRLTCQHGLAQNNNNDHQTLKTDND